MDTIEIIGAVIGICYLVLEYRANIWLWAVGILMPMIYIYIFYQHGFYANMGINIYYLLASVYGWWKWKQGKKTESDSGIVHLPGKKILPYTLAAIVLFVVITAILRKCTDSTVPYGDAFIAALSILGMWMMAHKQLEQWFVWILTNIASFVIYLHSGMYPTAFFYLLYSVVSVFGYLNWRKMMLSSPTQKSV